MKPSQLPNLIRLGVALRRAHRTRDLDEQTPRIVALNPSSSAVLERARMLADDGREDPDSASELIALANKNQRTLREAALGARQGGEHLESSWANRTHRLLQAAIAGAPVTPVPDTERKRLKFLDDFADLSPKYKWHLLVEREPRLSELEADARAGKFGGRTRPGELADLPIKQRQETAASRLLGRKRLEDRLAPLIGPQSRSSDALICSHTALNTARGHLLDLPAQE